MKWDNFPGLLRPNEMKPRAIGRGFLHWSAMFYLCTQDDGRVVLAGKPEGRSPTPVSGETWLEARENVDPWGLEYVAGHGWFDRRRQ